MAIQTFPFRIKIYRTNSCYNLSILIFVFNYLFYFFLLHETISQEYNSYSMGLQLIFINQIITGTSLYKFLRNTAQIFTLSNIRGTSTPLTF